MVVHAIDFVCSADFSAAFVGGTNSYIAVWLTNYTAYEPDGNLTQDNTPPTLSTTDTGVDYYHNAVPWRFALAEDYSTMIENLRAQAAAYRTGGQWYRIRYHVCDHDEDGDRDCEWDPAETRVGGTVPEGVP